MHGMSASGQFYVHNLLGENEIQHELHFFKKVGIFEQKVQISDFFIAEHWEYTNIIIIVYWAVNGHAQTKK